MIRFFALKNRLKEPLIHVQWASRISRATNPLLFYALWVNALVGTVFPAGLALSVRGLVNTVNDGLIRSDSFEPAQVYLWLGLGFAATLGAVLTVSLNRYLGRRLEEELRYSVQLDILHHNQTMEYSRFEDPAYHDTLQRARQSPETHLAQSLTFCLDLLTKFIQSVSLAVILVVIEPLLFFLLLPLSLPYLYYQWRLSRRQFKEVDERIEKQRRIAYYAGLMSSEEQAAEVKVLGLAPLFIERCRALLEEFRGLMLRYLRHEFVGNMVFVGISVVIIYLIMGRVAFAIVNGRLSIGDLVVYGSAAAQLRMLVESCVRLLAGLRWQTLHVHNLRRFLELPTGSEPSGEGKIADLQGGIVFRSVGFAYPGSQEPVLQDVSFKIDPGETVALVGLNGAGKTTVAKLLLRLYDPAAGQVLVDGKDVRSLNVQHLRRQVACVFQHFGRYAVSAGENIAFGDWERLLQSRQGIRDVARAADVHDMIEAMPQGYDTVLGRAFGEHVPSGGQWQQLALARALARDAKILILDEPTANLDIKTEYEIFRRFRELATGRTTLLISHRFSTVHMADRILVLEGGRIIENGSHGQLMDMNGRYASLYRLHMQHFNPA